MAACAKGWCTGITCISHITASFSSLESHFASLYVSFFNCKTGLVISTFLTCLGIKYPFLVDKVCGSFLKSSKDYTNASYYLKVHEPWALPFTFWINANFWPMKQKNKPPSRYAFIWNKLLVSSRHDLL